MTIGTTILINDKAIQKEIRSFISIDHWDNPVAATLTLKGALIVPAIDQGQPDQLVPIDRDRAVANFKHFRNLLDRNVYGNAARRFDKHVRIIPVLEGSSTVRLHYHAAIDRPSHIEPSAFMKLVEECWRRTAWGHQQTHIQPHADAGWIDYMIKFRTKSDFGLSIDWINFRNS